VGVATATAWRITEERAKLRDVPDVGKVRSRVRETRKGPETYFYIDFYPHLKGAERRLYGVMGSKFRSEEDAENTRKRICHDASRLGLADAAAQFRQPRTRRNLVMTHAKRWLEEASRSLMPYTVAGYRSILKQYFGFWEPKSIREITTANVREWVSELRSRGLSEKSIKNALVPLRSTLTRYREERPEVPAPIWPKIRVSRQPQQRMPLEDILSVLSAIPEEDAGVFLAAFYTMARPGEARALLIEDYDFRSGRLTIRRALKTTSGENPVPGGTKTDETGVYALPGDLRAWLQKWRGEARLDRSAPLFPNPRTGHAWATGRMEKHWRLACERAQVPYVPVYRALKHSPGTALLEAGLSREDLQAAFRHKSARTTTIYELENTQRRERATAKLEEMVGTRFGDNWETSQKAAKSLSPETEGVESDE